MPIRFLTLVAFGLLLASSAVPAASIINDVNSLTNMSGSATHAGATGDVLGKLNAPQILSLSPLLHDVMGKFTSAKYNGAGRWFLRNRAGYGTWMMRGSFFTSTAAVERAFRRMRVAVAHAQARTSSDDTLPPVRLTEPGSLILLSLGFAIMGLMLRRRVRTAVA